MEITSRVLWYTAWGLVRSICWLPRAPSWACTASLLRPLHPNPSSSGTTCQGLPAYDGLSGMGRFFAVINGLSPDRGATKTQRIGRAPNNHSRVFQKASEANLIIPGEHPVTLLDPTSSGGWGSFARLSQACSVERCDVSGGDRLQTDL